MLKINQLEIENVKRIRAVKIEPSQNGLTIIGGNNNQGKTSVLDSIAWALGGDRYRPSAATRDGSAIPPRLHIVMSNGLVVERKRQIAAQLNKTRQEKADLLNSAALLCRTRVLGPASRWSTPICPRPWPT